MSEDSERPANLISDEAYDATEAMKVAKKALADGDLETAISRILEAIDALAHGVEDVSDRIHAIENA